MLGYEAFIIDRINKIVVISTGAKRSGEIYSGRFRFAEPSGSRLRCAR